MKDNVLIVTTTPPPVNGEPTVWGNGVRAYGLAQGLLDNGMLGITIAYEYNEQYKDRDYTNSSVKVVSYTSDTIKALVKKYKTVITPYFHNVSQLVVDGIGADQQLVADGYSPTYVEMSARNYYQEDNQYEEFVGFVKKFNRVLQRVDLLICGNEKQKDFYYGVLAALGRLNPLTYKDDMVLVVPYGTDESITSSKIRPITKILGKKQKNEKRILWFGGVYPWFDITILAKSISELNNESPVKLIVVGAKRQNTSEDDTINKSYRELKSFIKNNNLADQVILHDWVEFKDIVDWYEDADLIVSVNQEDLENTFSWRTRLMDYLRADTPIATNGGDPLGDLLIKEGIAQRLNTEDKSSMVKSLRAILSSLPSTASPASVRKSFYWSAVTKKLAERIKSNDKASDSDRTDTLQAILYDDKETHAAPTGFKSKVKNNKIAYKTLKPAVLLARGVRKRLVK